MLERYTVLYIFMYSMRSGLWKFVCFFVDHQLGYGDQEPHGPCWTTSNQSISQLVPIDFGLDFEIAQLMVMYQHNCVLSTKDELKCWGKYSVFVYNFLFVSLSLSVHDLVDMHTVCIYEQDLALMVN